MSKICWVPVCWDSLIQGVLIWLRNRYQSLFNVFFRTLWRTTTLVFRGCFRRNNHLVKAHTTMRLRSYRESTTQFCIEVVLVVSAAFKIICLSLKYILIQIRLWHKYWSWWISFMRHEEPPLHISTKESSILPWSKRIGMLLCIEWFILSWNVFHLTYEWQHVVIWHFIDSFATNVLRCGTVYIFTDGDLIPRA